ncbi:MAG: HEPN domain-containing protein [Candidatus Latescibacterota bacterium]
MDEGFKVQALEWFERGDHNIETAKMLLRNEWYTDVIAYHIQQAIEMYLKGFIVLHGKNPPKIHELDVLLSQAARYDKRLNPFLELCEKATKYYLEDRYPPGPLVQYSYAEIKGDMEKTDELIRNMREIIGI